MYLYNSLFNVLLSFMSFDVFPSFVIRGPSGVLHGRENKVPLFIHSKRKLKSAS